MLELEDCPRTGGAGYVPQNKITVDEVVDVLALRIRTDERGGDTLAWASKLEDADLFHDMDSQMLSAVLYAVMSTNCAYMSRVQDYVRFKIADELGD